MSRRPNGPRLRSREEPGFTGPVYYIYWTDHGRTQKKSTGEQDFNRAQAAFEDWLGARRRATKPRTSDPNNVCVSDVLTDYAAEHGQEVASPATLAYSIEPLRAFFADDTIADLTTGRVKEYWVWRRKHSVRTLPDETATIVEGGAGDGTIIRELGGTMRPAIQHAIKQKRLKPSVYYVPLPAAPSGRDYWIKREEAAALLRQTRRDTRSRLHLPLYALIALYTGQRRGAILDLTWKQVDLARGVIDFNAPGRQQTKKRRPIIPAPRSLMAALRRAHKRASSEYVIAYKGERIGNVTTGFNSAADRAGIPRCTSHTLRHTAGTWMAQRGVPLWEIAGYLGHSVSRTTELYAHHHPDFLKGARAAFE